MSDKKHNGWANYETWAVNLWLSNDSGTYEYWRDRARQHTSVSYGSGSFCELADEMEEEIGNKVEDFTPDLGATVYSDLLNAALSEVNWCEEFDTESEIVKTSKTMKRFNIIAYYYKQSDPQETFVDSPRLVEAEAMSVAYDIGQPSPSTVDANDDVWLLLNWVAFPLGGCE